MAKYKLTRIDTGSVWACKTYAEALTKATVLRNEVVKISNGLIKPKFRIEEN